MFRTSWDGLSIEGLGKVKASGSLRTMTWHLVALKMRDYLPIFLDKGEMRLDHQDAFGVLNTTANYSPDTLS